MQLPVPKYLFPEGHRDSSRLTYYSTFFNSIEFNSTFYKIPRNITVKKWSESVSKEFRFTFKMWKEITHCRNLSFNEGDIDRFLEAADSVYEKKGCLLIQFPPSVGKEYFTQLNELLSSIRARKKSEWSLAVEFRSRSWYDEKVFELLDFHRAAMVIHDMNKSTAPMAVLDSDFLYIRFHGPEGNYRGSYSDSFLYEYADYILEWLRENKTIYVYFNNTMGEAFQNLQTLNKFIMEKMTDSGDLNSL